MEELPMKTLDEVIFEAPYIMTPWEENAIYYLNEYRDHIKNEIIELQEEVKKQKEMIEFLEKPLTWDELQQMEGKPVWVEFLNYDLWDDPEHHTSDSWWVVGEVRKDDIIIAQYLDEAELCEEDLGDVWQAYRKERK